MVFTPSCVVTAPRGFSATAANSAAVALATMSVTRSPELARAVAPAASGDPDASCVSCVFRLCGMCGWGGGGGVFVVKGGGGGEDGGGL